MISEIYFFLFLGGEIHVNKTKYHFQGILSPFAFKAELHLLEVSFFVLLVTCYA